MSKIENVKVEVKEGKELNDLDILNDLLQCLKNMCNNYSISVHEMSNKVLFKKVFKILKETNGVTRELYDLAFRKGWYSLETSSEYSIKKEYDSALKMLKQL